MATQSHVEQRRNPFETEEYDVTKQRTEPINKTTTTSVQVPDAGTMEFIRQQAAPVAQSMGIDPNTGKVITPFEALGYDPEKERQRREAEQRLNEFKKKESGWYNALSIVGDALTAAHGGNVWRRDANKTAAQAEKDNQRLIAEQKAEDVYNREKLRGKELSYAKYLQDALAPYLGKTSQTTTEYKQFNDVTHHGAQKGYKTTSHVVSDGDGTGGGYDKSGNYTGKDGKKIAVTINSDPNNIHTNDYVVSPKDYDVVMGIVKQRYADLIKNGTPETQQATMDFLNRIGVVYDEEKGRFSDEDQLLQSGIYFGLDDNVRKKIKEKTNGRFTMGQPTYWQPSSQNNQPRNDAE